MSKLQMEPPLGDGVAPRFFVRVRRRPRPREPWTWEIYEKGRAEPCRRSTRFYRDDGNDPRQILTQAGLLGP